MRSRPPFVRGGVGDEFLNSVTEHEKKMLLYDYQFSLESGEPRIDELGFIAALSLLQRLKPCRPMTRAAHSADALMDENAVASLITLADIPKLRTVEDKGKGIRFGISRVPGSDICYGSGKTVEFREGNFVPYLGLADGWGPSLTAVETPTWHLSFLPIWSIRK